MTVDEMINFDISNFVTQIAKEADLKIVDGVYTVSQEYELEFNKEEIKKLLLMFKPMQKELENYKKALELSCKVIENMDCSMPTLCDKCELHSPCCYLVAWEDYFLNKAKEVK